MKTPDMNPHYLSVMCLYCNAKPGEECRQTMLDRRPPTETHKMRIIHAGEPTF